MNACPFSFNFWFAYSSFPLNIFLFGSAVQHAGSQFPHQESDPHSLCWECRVLTTEQGSPSLNILKSAYNDYLCHLFTVE